MVKQSVTETLNSLLAYLRKRKERSLPMPIEGPDENDKDVVIDAAARGKIEEILGYLTDDEEVPEDAEAEKKADKQPDKSEEPSKSYEPKLLPNDGQEIRLGKPTSAYSSGATMTLDPCDAHGTDNGEANVTVQAGYTMTVGPENETVAIPVTAIVPFVEAADGLWYVFGNPREVMTDLQYNTSTHILEGIWIMDFGLFSSNVSSLQTITTSVACP